MCFKHGSCSLSRHGHCKDQDVQDGIERGIGNGRHSSVDTFSLAENDLYSFRLSSDILGLGPFIL